MRVWRILLSSWTSSFRYPNIMVKKQPSIKAPPYTTIQGLLAAASGKHNLEGTNFGYVFRYETSFYDIETTYKMKEDKGKIGFEYKAGGKYLKQKALWPNSDAFEREILSGCTLTLYLTDESLAKAFRTPFYQLLLGRSNDLLQVHSIEEIEVEETADTAFYGSVLDFKHEAPTWDIVGELYAMPRSFKYSGESPNREPQDVRPFAIQDGEGHYLKTPRVLSEKFDLRNWKFKKPLSTLRRQALYDEELDTQVIWRTL